MMSYEGKHIAVFGASGGIGSACVHELLQSGALLSVFSRSAVKGVAGDDSQILNQLHGDITDESDLKAAAEVISASPPLTGILITAGMLHDQKVQPEKSIKQVCADNFMQVLAVNTLGPSLVARYFTPLLARQQRVWYAALSARVGSIQDNRLGGWYAYRASKAALNMVIKNLSIEMGRRNKSAVVVGLHPGTVDSGLSKPFQAGVSPEKLFTAAHSAQCLLNVLASLSPEHSGGCFDWAGQEIPA